MGLQPERFTGFRQGFRYSASGLLNHGDGIAELWPAETVREPRR